MRINECESTSGIYSVKSPSIIPSLVKKQKQKTDE
jgi:hypothetical protein